MYMCPDISKTVILSLYTLHHESVNSVDGRYPLATIIGPRARGTVALFTLII